VQTLPRAWARGIKPRLKSIARGRRTAPRTASNDAAKTNRVHRFERFALRVGRPRAVFGRLSQKNFALVNLLLPTLFAALSASRQRMSRGAEERDEQITSRSKKPQFIGTSTIL
jgi:hypothetical protein